MSTERDRKLFGDINKGLRRFCFGRRLEIGVAFVVVATRVIFSHLPETSWTDALLGIAAAVFITLEPTRKWLCEFLLRERIWRRFARAMSLAGVPEAEFSEPSQVAVGIHAVLDISPGSTASDYWKGAESMAVCFRARSVRVLRDPADASQVAITVVTQDPFSGPGLRWPWTELQHSSMWGGLPIGQDEEGHLVWLELAEHHLLIGGEPGGGKSNALSLIVAAAALDPSTQLWCFDAKLVELAAWKDISKVFVGPDIEEATVAIESLRAEMDNRYKWMLKEKLRKVSPETGAGLVVVVIDELALYLQGSGKTRDAFALGLRDLVARGRAAGIVVVAATQKPAHDVVPTALRDLFGYRLALRCSTRDASDTVLGSGWAAQGHSASDIDPATRGVGLLLAERGVPRRLRCHLLSDFDIERLAERAADVRAWPRGWS